MHVYIYICFNILKYIFIYVYVHVYMFIHVHIYIKVNICIQMYTIFKFSQDYLS